MKKMKIQFKDLTNLKIIIIYLILGPKLSRKSLGVPFALRALRTAINHATKALLRQNCSSGGFGSSAISWRTI